MFRILTRSFSISHLAALVAVLGLFFLGSPPANGQSLDSIERQRALDMLKVIRDDLKKDYYDPNFQGMDLDARFKAAEDKLKKATSLSQALGTIAQALMDLNDSHAFFIPPSRPERVEYGWYMQTIGDKSYVVAVKPNSAAESTGLK